MHTHVIELSPYKDFVFDMVSKCIQIIENLILILTNELCVAVTAAYKKLRFTNFQKYYKKMV